MIANGSDLTRLEDDLRALLGNHSFPYAERLDNGDIHVEVTFSLPELAETLVSPTELRDPEDLALIVKRLKAKAASRLRKLANEWEVS